MGAAARHVLDSRDESGNRNGRLQLGDGAHRAQNGGASGHVVAHLIHILGGFDGYSAGIEGHTFADQSEVVLGGWRGCRLITEHDERGGLGAALCHAQQRAHAQLPHAVLVENFTAENEFGRELAGALGETHGR